MSKVRGVMMQFFHWNLPNDGNLWKELITKAKELYESGITALWLPPAYKGWQGMNDVGYGVYDLYDLGEFEQKGCVKTKYGSKQEFLDAVKASQEAGLQVYADVVFNHKMGADKQERVSVIHVNYENRNEVVGDWHERDLWTHYTFEGRGKKYSDMEWHWWHFDASKEHGIIYKMKDKQFETHVDSENVNYDFLMGCDLDMNNEEALKDLYHWGEWFYDMTKVDGFRIDAIKHIRSFFFNGWLDHLRKYTGKEMFAVGEYWSSDLNRLKKYIHDTEGKMAIFDVPLHYNFHEASIKGRDYDLRRIFDNTLVQFAPTLAVTLVDNHDTQPLQSLESLVEAWFKPLAYAFILLRTDGYPCVFYADYYGAQYKGSKNHNEYDILMHSHKWMIDLFLDARSKYTFGIRRDFFETRNCIGWTFEGEEGGKSMAVIISNAEEASLWMETGKENAVYKDITNHIDKKITTNEFGWAPFSCKSGSVSLWIEE